MTGMMQEEIESWGYTYADRRCQSNIFQQKSTCLLPDSGRGGEGLERTVGCKERLPRLLAGLHCYTLDREIYRQRQGR